MNINRNNYEEFFMLYADNELTAAERKTVEQFIAANPDLQQELAVFSDFKLDPDTTVVFAGKETLMKQESGAASVTLNNYETFFVLYADDELNSDEKAAVATFLHQHPQLQPSFDLIQKTKMEPDADIVFENKESLYRKETDDKVIPFGWWKIAVAAIVLLMAGIIWLYQSGRDSKPNVIVKTKSTVTNPEHPSLNKKEEKKNGDTIINEQPGKEAVAATDSKKEPLQSKNALSLRELNTAAKTPVSPDKDGNSNETVAVVNNTIDQIADQPLKRSMISSVKSNESKEAVINTDIAAAASKSVINQQLVYHNTEGEEDGNTVARQAVSVNNDNLEVLNTSVDTKNSLRGFFRKASRLINKKNNSGEEDGKRKSILIGGFEIAVR